MKSNLKKIVLTEEQKKIYEGKICPYCRNKTVYVDSTIIYGRSYGMIYLCEPCDAYVGVHKGTDKAKGRLANSTLRYWKKEAHKFFDVIWKNKHEKRGKVYKRLAEHLNIEGKFCHIGMFSVETCKIVVEWSKKVLETTNKKEK